VNLEAVETECVRYLRQVANPIVPLHTLLRHLWQEDQFEAVTEPDLLGFLREHELFYVYECTADEPDQYKRLEEAGILTGPRVILKDRMPTQTQMTLMMQAELDSMTTALNNALETAEQAGNAEASKRIREILARAEKLREDSRKLL